ncbi:MAG: hypothetical protein LCH91_13785 [Bacteroidetes bacterium]|nr:hypothetical protein [Bacteroidota bacterium]
MQTKRFTPTKAKLPENERVIGGDASPKLFKKRDVRKTEVELSNHFKNRGKK